MFDKETAKKLSEKYSSVKDDEPAPHLLEAQDFWFDGNFDEAVQLMYKFRNELMTLKAKIKSLDTSS
jgi:hypothetical protein